MMGGFAELTAIRPLEFQAGTRRTIQVFRFSYGQNRRGCNCEGCAWDGNAFIPDMRVLNART
jgi:hypothetical protein